MNGYIFLANVVVFLHLLYVVFVLAALPLILIGGFLKWKWVRNFWFRILHFLMMFIVVVETAFGVTCPLTTWESDLRVLGGQSTLLLDEEGNIQRDERGRPYVNRDEKKYEADFVGRCMRQILFFDPNDVSPWILNSCYFLLGAIILLTLVFVPPRWPWKRAGP